VSDVLPLREPIPRVFKTGRNVDALQTAYTNPVYGNINDDLIWRIQVQNSGLADLQDLRFDDLMQAGNMVINYACRRGERRRGRQQQRVRPGGSPCVNASNTIPDFDVDNPFGNPGNDSPDLVDVRRGSSAFIYLVGKITSSCATSKTNTVSDIQWVARSIPRPAASRRRLPARRRPVPWRVCTRCTASARRSRSSAG